MAASSGGSTSSPANIAGISPKWAISMELLHKKSGSTDLLKRFRAAVKRIASANTLPDYWLEYTQIKDQMTFHTKDTTAP